MSYEKPFWLNDKIEPRTFSADEDDAILRRAARSVFLPKRIRALEQKLNKIEDKRDHPKGFDGLKQKKQDLHLDGFNLTKRQQEVMSLLFEYSLPKVEVANRLGIHRTTVDEHLDAAKRRMNAQAADWRKAKRRRASSPD